MAPRTITDFFARAFRKSTKDWVVINGLLKRVDVTDSDLQTQRPQERATSPIGLAIPIAAPPPQPDVATPQPHDNEAHQRRNVDANGFSTVFKRFLETPRRPARRDVDANGYSTVFKRFLDQRGNDDDDDDELADDGSNSSDELSADLAAVMDEQEDAPCTPAVLKRPRSTQSFAASSPRRSVARTPTCAPKRATSSQSFGSSPKRPRHTPQATVTAPAAPEPPTAPYDPDGFPLLGGGASSVPTLNHELFACPVHNLSFDPVIPNTRCRKVETAKGRGAPLGNKRKGADKPDKNQRCTKVPTPNFDRPNDFLDRPNDFCK